MLENWTDIRFIQQLLGHARLDTTQIYTDVSIVQLREVHSRTHPHGRFRRVAASADPPDPAVLARPETGKKTKNRTFPACLLVAIAALFRAWGITPQ